MIVCYIGIQNIKGEYLINLPSWSRTVYKAGTKIQYIRKSGPDNDEIIIPGPVNQPLKLVVSVMYIGTISTTQVIAVVTFTL